MGLLRQVAGDLSRSELTRVCCCSYPTPLPDTFPKSVADIDDSIFSEKFPYPLDPLHSDALTQATVGAPACRDDTDQIGAASTPPAAADGALLVDAEQASSTDQQLLTLHRQAVVPMPSSATASATSAAQVVGTIRWTCRPGVEAKVLVGDCVRTCGCWAELRSDLARRWPRSLRNVRLYHLARLDAFARPAHGHNNSGR